MSGNSEQSSGQSDTLLWLAGALVVGMGVTWLVLAKPWAGTDTESALDELDSVSAPAEPAPAAGASRAPQSQVQIGSSLQDDPLRMARLAYEAGMLVEPEDYSAWALYRKALESSPDDPEARKGLETIAAELVRRGQAALEQGRFDDVRATVARIRTAIPVHPGANDLEIRLNELAPREGAEPELAVAPPTEEEGQEPLEDAPQTADEQTEPASGEPGQDEAPADPLADAHEAFAAALDANRLLTPTDASAKHFLDVLTSIDPEHERTLEARQSLFGEFLARAEQALGTRDTEAAEIWVEEAELLAVDGDAVAGVRALLHDQLIDIESAKRLPASELTIIEYAAPEYPLRALQRELNGWVDLEFTVGRDGTTRNIVVTDASHNNYFRDEAIEAVEQWRFEPKIFLDQPIEQRTYTTIRFEVQ
ncbi:MAG: energy transducer TonB [Gammaproteobacteria bacterium]|nr:energy transducer TonB [Gammaproteobacteria bacterium]